MFAEGDKRADQNRIRPAAAATASCSRGSISVFSTQPDAVFCENVLRIVGWVLPRQETRPRRQWKLESLNCLKVLCDQAFDVA